MDTQPSEVLAWLEGWIASLPVTPESPADLFVPWHLSPDELAQVPLDGRFAISVESGPDRESICFESMQIAMTSLWQVGRDTRYRMVDRVRYLRRLFESEAHNAFAAALSREMRPVVVESIGYDYTAELGLVIVEIRLGLVYHVDPS